MLDKILLLSCLSGCDTLGFILGATFELEI